LKRPARSRQKARLRRPSRPKSANVGRNARPRGRSARSRGPGAEQRRKLDAFAPRPSCLVRAGGVEGAEHGGDGRLGEHRVAREGGEVAPPEVLRAGVDLGKGSSAGCAAREPDGEAVGATDDGTERIDRTAAVAFEGGARLRAPGGPRGQGLPLVRRERG